ncbi:hypothetical protein [Butyrivibrio sp. AC2005]|uniref:hypothetical protein n=1 Tax=Butyrivibrio sp. AC2005 TaxID=1280672 RepID=UPI0003F7E5B3|nr:hypothetical protein [Butyrivibrio sp. AC2005]
MAGCNNPINRRILSFVIGGELSESSKAGDAGKIAEVGEIAEASDLGKTTEIIYGTDDIAN